MHTTANLEESREGDLFLGFGLMVGDVGKGWEGRGFALDEMLSESEAKAASLSIIAFVSPHRSLILGKI